MEFKIDLSDPFKILFVFWAVAVSFILPLASTDAGITEDEPVHLEHGKKIYAWYTGYDQTAGESPFDEKGQWKYLTEGAESKTAINVFGGFFDLLAEVCHHTIFSGLDEYKSRHMLSAFLGALLFVFTALIAHRISESWRVALLTIIIATFTPRLFGYSLNNPKDIPLAAFFTFSLLQIVSFIKELPRIRLLRVVLLTVSFSFAITIRSGSVILIFYLLLFLFFYFVLQFLSGDTDKKYFAKTFLIAIGICFVGYLATSLLWPWALSNPLLNPVRSLLVFKSFDVIIIKQLFEGRWIGLGELPWYFVPKWLYITLPVTVVSGSVIFLILTPKFFRKENWRITSYMLLIFSVIFPVISIIINHSNVYDSARHVTFVIPSMIVLASLAWAEIFKRIKYSSLQISLGIAFLIILSEPVLFTFKNHPLQAMYFSPLIGGTKAAFKNYEMDYWGFSIKPAFDWIEQHDSVATLEKKTRIRMWYGEQLKLKHFVEKSSRFQYVLAQEDSKDWDYSIQLPAEGKYDNDVLYHWSPKGTVYEVMVDGTPICAVKKNYRITANAETSVNEQAITSVEPVANFLNEGMNYYNKKDFNAAIILFKKASELAPENVLIFNNLVACFNELKMFDEALEYGKKGLKIDPNFILLKNNLTETAKAKERFQPDTDYYINLSYNYYAQRDFEKCIIASKKFLKLKPDSFLAWNNICSAYTQLKQYDKAIEACNKGLELAPANQLLKNNKEFATKARGK